MRDLEAIRAWQRCPAATRNQMPTAQCVMALLSEKAWLSQEAWRVGSPFVAGSRPGCRPGSLTLTGVRLDAPHFLQRPSATKRTPRMGSPG